jgi:hypothetical protein
MEIEKSIDKTPADYEKTFNKIKIKVNDYYIRYNNVIKRNNGDAAGYISIFGQIMKDYVHKDVIKIKDWLNYNYRRDEKPLGTYLDEQLTTLEKTLESKESDNIKQTYFSKALSNIYESLPKLEDKIRFA